MRRFLVPFLALLILVLPSAILPGQIPQAQPQTQPREQTVYITKTGKKYHRAGCRYLSKSKIPMSLKDAKTNGYTPCNVCRPPQ